MGIVLESMVTLLGKDNNIKGTQFLWGEQVTIFDFLLKPYYDLCTSKFLVNAHAIF